MAQVKKRGLSEGAAGGRRGARGTQWSWLALLSVLGIASGAAATPVSSGVSVLPAVPTEADAIFLDVDYLFPTTGFFLDTFSLFFPAPGEILVEIDVSAPDPGEPVLFILTPVAVDVFLGSLEAGAYLFTVELYETPRSSLPLRELTDTLAGGFAVVPEPATGSLLLLGLALGAWRRRCTGR